MIKILATAFIVIYFSAIDIGKAHAKEFVIGYLEGDWSFQEGWGEHPGDMKNLKEYSPHRPIDGARVGLRRVVELMDRHSIPASFFIPAVSLILSPDMVEVIQKSGRHEFGVHGWVHELNSALDAETERDLVLRATNYLEKVTGRRPIGYRAPSWNFSPNTLDIIKSLGFLYDSSLMSDDRPYELLQNGNPTGLVELPVEWILDDAPLMNPLGDRYTSPRELLQVYIDEFDKAYEEGTMFLLTTHPHIIGHRSRILILEKLIDHIKTKEGVWFGTHEEAVRYVKEQAGW